jgi:hypothetical protein
MSKEFNKSFGIKVSLLQEQSAFINRATSLLHDLRHRVLDEAEYSQLFKTSCFQLGLNAETYIDYGWPRDYIPDLSQIVPTDFISTLRLLTIVRKAYSGRQEIRDLLDKAYQDLINAADGNLGITYNAGAFYPKGEEVLDEDLINHSLNVLSGYPNEDKDLREGLDNYKAGKKTGVIETCYRCVEGLARQILNNKKTLIDNKADILRTLSLSDHWKKILANYIEYGNEYGRHASENRHNVNEAEVEAYLYTTCILIRLILRIKSN